MANTQTKSKKLENLTEVYALKLEPLLPLARKAYGLRGQATPEHRASAKYTSLVKEYFAKGGSLMELSKRIDVHYSGLRRRVYMSETPPVPRKNRSKVTPEATAATIDKIKAAKRSSVEDYHKALYKAYHAGYSLAAIAKGLGISSSSPLYYAVQRHETTLAGKTK